MFLSVNISKYPLQQTSVCIAANVQGLLLCWNSCSSARQLKPINNLMMNLQQKAH